MGAWSELWRGSLPHALSVAVGLMYGGSALAWATGIELLWALPAVGIAVVAAGTPAALLARSRPHLTHMALTEDRLTLRWFDLEGDRADVGVTEVRGAYRDRTHLVIRLPDRELRLVGAQAFADATDDLLRRCGTDDPQLDSAVVEASHDGTVLLLGTPLPTWARTIVCAFPDSRWLKGACCWLSAH